MSAPRQSRRKPGTIEKPWRFGTVERNARGRIVRSEPFDVPDEDYGIGWMTGLRAAGEFMAALQHEPGFAFGQARAVLDEVHRVREAPFDPLPSRQGAGNAFMEQMVAFLRFAALHCDHAAFVQTSVQWLEESRRRVEQAQARRKAELVERLRRGREAKKAARLASADRMEAAA